MSAFSPPAILVSLHSRVKRKMLNAYFKFVQQSDFTFFFVLINFVSYFCQFLMI